MSCQCNVPAAHQVEFEGIKHHMRLDRGVVVSLDLLAPSKYVLVALSGPVLASDALHVAACICQALSPVAWVPSSP